MFNLNLTRGDKILIAALFVLNAVLFARIPLRAPQGDWVVIEVDRKEVARLPLSMDRVTQVEGPLGLTEVEIHEGKARIVRSPCKNKVCIKSGYLQYADRWAACVPNRVLVRILGKNHRGLDAVVG